MVYTESLYFLHIGAPNAQTRLHESADCMKVQSSQSLHCFHAQWCHIAEVGPFTIFLNFPNYSLHFFQHLVMGNKI